MEKEQNSAPLPLLQITSVLIIAAYGWKENFSDLDEAIEYVLTINELVEDPVTPLDNIQVMVEFGTGENERCAYNSKERTLQWLNRFKTR